MESRWQDLIDQLRIDVSESEGNLRDICRDILEEFGFTDVSTQRATGGQFDPYIAVPDNFPCYFDLVGKHADTRMSIRQNNISSKNKLDEYLSACSDARDRMEAPRLERARRAEPQQPPRQRSPPRRAPPPPRAPERPRRSPPRAQRNEQKIIDFGNTIGDIHWRNFSAACQRDGHEITETTTSREFRELQRTLEGQALESYNSLISDLKEHAGMGGCIETITPGIEVNRNGWNQFVVYYYENHYPDSNLDRSPPPVAPTPNRNPAPLATTSRRGPVVRASVVDICTRGVTGPP